MFGLFKNKEEKQKFTEEELKIKEILDTIDIVYFSSLKGWLIKITKPIYNGETISFLEDKRYAKYTHSKTVDVTTWSNVPSWVTVFDSPEKALDSVRLYLELKHYIGTTSYKISLGERTEGEDITVNKIKKLKTFKNFEYIERES